MLGSAPVATTGHPELRLWTPWTMFHSGSLEDGTGVVAGSAFFYLGYVLSLCAAAVIGAVWHDRTARTGRLVAAFVGVVVIGSGSLGLAMTTGVDENLRSEPIPHKIND